MNPRVWGTWAVIIAVVIGLWTYGSTKAQAVECRREAPCRIV